MQIKKNICLRKKKIILIIKKKFIFYYLIEVNIYLYILFACNIRHKKKEVTTFFFK